MPNRLLTRERMARVADYIEAAGRLAVKLGPNGRSREENAATISAAGVAIAADAELAEATRDFWTELAKERARR